MLELDRVSFAVEDESGGGNKEILTDISLTFGGRSFVVITGPNGGGKSTLAKIIMGMERPTAGRIFFEGKDITDLSVPARAERGIGFAFQQPVRFKGLCVRDLLRMAAGRELSTREACAFLSEVGLCAMEYIDREVNQSLSGGELKRIEIAILIARKVKLSVFDEPEAGIDLWSFQNLIRVFERIRDTTHGSVIIISHQERILSIADQLVVISGGRVTQAGPRDEVLPTLLPKADACKFCEEEVRA